jgi:hypothetical protein
MWFLAWGCGVVHASTAAGPSFGEACALMGMLGCAILIPGPPGLLGVFQAGIYAGDDHVLPDAASWSGAGAAIVFLLYVSQVLFTLITGGLALLFERSGIKVLEQA